MFEIIDAHIHTAFGSELLMESARISGVDYSLSGLRREMMENNLQFAISMGLESMNNALLSHEAETPMANHVSESSIIPVGGINPYKAEQSDLSRTKESLLAGEIRALKVYLGYFHKYAYDDVYKKFYELAAQFGVPVIFHTGDNYDRNAKIKYAHPLTIDEVAVDFRGTNFIIAHMGNPWTVDAGEVVYKNDNVYADLSGLFLGNADSLGNIDDRDLENIVEAYRWVGTPTKFLYGSDWPIVPIKPYISLVEKILKEATTYKDYEYHRERIFYENASELFMIRAVK
jgi:predicted TIM-barrel fold metal-dependent hydrolase